MTDTAGIADDKEVRYRVAWRARDGSYASYADDDYSHMTKERADCFRTHMTLVDSLHEYAVESSDGKMIAPWRQQPKQDETGEQYTFWPLVTGEAEGKETNGPFEVEFNYRFNQGVSNTMTDGSDSRAQEAITAWQRERGGANLHLVRWFTDSDLYSEYGQLQLLAFMQSPAAVSVYCPLPVANKLYRQLQKVTNKIRLADSTFTVDGGAALDATIKQGEIFRVEGVPVYLVDVGHPGYVDYGCAMTLRHVKSDEVRREFDDVLDAVLADVTVLEDGAVTMAMPERWDTETYNALATATEDGHLACALVATADLYRQLSADQAIIPIDVESAGLKVYYGGMTVIGLAGVITDAGQHPSRRRVKQSVLLGRAEARRSFEQAREALRLSRKD